MLTIVRDLLIVLDRLNIRSGDVECRRRVVLRTIMTDGYRGVTEGFGNGEVSHLLLAKILT